MTTHAKRAADRTGPSPRELEILRLIADGLSYREIGKRLFLSELTVKTHKQNLFGVIGVRCAAHAVAVGFRRGWLT